MPPRWRCRTWVRRFPVANRQATSRGRVVAPGQYSSASMMSQSSGRASTARAFPCLNYLIEANHGSKP
jgi:hypothetical protein